MLRYLVPVLALVAMPAFAGDEFLRQIFDADGPAITAGVPAGDQMGSGNEASQDEDVSPDEQTVRDAAFDAAMNADPVVEGDCPPDRYGTCPELLSPEALAEYEASLAKASELMAHRPPPPKPIGGDWSLTDPTVNPDGSAKEEVPPAEEPSSDPPDEPSSADVATE